MSAPLDFVIYRQIVGNEPTGARYVGYFTETRNIPKQGVKTLILPVRFEGMTESEVKQKADAQIAADRERNERKAQSAIARAEGLARARAEKADAS